MAKCSDTSLDTPGKKHRTANYAQSAYHLYTESHFKHWILIW